MRRRFFEFAQFKRNQGVLKMLHDPESVFKNRLLHKACSIPFGKALPVGTMLRRKVD